MRQIPKLGTPKDYDLLKLVGVDGNSPLGLENRHEAIMKGIYEDVKKDLDTFYEALDFQFKLVYDKAIADGIIKGKPTPTKFKRAGYVVCHHEGVGSYITRNGERVSEIVNVPKPDFEYEAKWPLHK
jgi:hypothetical protein